MTTREALRRNTRANVLAAAAKLFQERGFETTTIRDIAETAQVSVGTVMLVGDKSTLLVRIFDESIEKVHVQRVPGLLEEPRSTTRSCADGVFELLQPFALLFAGQADLARSYASILVAGKHSSKVFAELAEVLKQEIRAVVSKQRGGCATDPESRATAVYFAYIGMLFLWSADGSVAGEAATSDETARLSQGVKTVLAEFCSCVKEAQ
ncbi:TetR/AcrR family transcriptional regulator [Leucobacter coleopterorum]|uniref:TetR/AcrR family transcriptional regulator n=1 Tax=Leucobacter coleopterorum TaxID=2714933 RepID=A0ABX6JVD6_9MICO|nr:TetR/AcrR family transcriptional regulator [Leucobacter coleopterorum]QIM18266.1 TetR/AcrR family transcriptional regulator [Leucobacter coleopterorum]